MKKRNQRVSKIGDVALVKENLPHGNLRVGRKLLRL